LNRFKIELPRICCHECASDFAKTQSSAPVSSTTIYSIGQAFKNYEQKKRQIERIQFNTKCS